MIVEYYFSSPHYTCLVKVNEHGIVVGGAPVIGWARGKSWNWLLEYARHRWGADFKCEALRGGQTCTR